MTADSLPITFVNEEMNNKLFADIEKSNPSDFIKITRDVDLKLIAIWENTKKNQGPTIQIPTDIFFAGTVPLLDCIIEVDERGAFPDREGAVVTSRIVVFADYNERIKKAGDSLVFVGAVLTGYEGRYGMVMPIVIAKGYDSIVGVTQIYYRNMTAKMREHVGNKYTIGQYVQTCTSFLETWYGIQIALLHPTVKSVFNQPSYIKAAALRKLSESERRNKVKYVKRHVIDPDNLEELVYGDLTGEGDAGRNSRYALIWYVIGHWRTFKDGKKTFVMPYWKGALRKIKKDITAREREIAVE